MERYNINIRGNITRNRAYDDGNNLWFVLNGANPLCRMEKNTGYIHIEMQLPKADKEVWRAYGEICKWNDCFVIAPHRSETDIAICDIKEKKTYQIPLKRLKPNNDVPKFSMCFPYKNYVYLVGKKYPAIVRLNMETLMVEYIVDWISAVDCNWKNSNKVYLNYGIIKENEAFLPFAETGSVLCLNLDTMDTQIITIPSSARGFSGFTYTQKKFWLIDRYESRVLVWNPDTGLVSEISIDDEQGNKNQELFSGIVLAQNELLLIPFKATHAYWLSTKNECVRKCMELESYIADYREKSGASVSGCYLLAQSEKGIYLDLDDDDRFCFCDFTNNIWSLTNKRSEKKLADVVVSRRYSNAILENEEEGLTDLLGALLETRNFYAVQPQQDPTGEKIYQALKVR